MRLVPSLRWSMERIGLVHGPPKDFKTKDYDVIVEDASPHTHPGDREDPEITERETRRLKISYELLLRYGFTPRCRRFGPHRQGLHARAKHLRHDEACRSRIYRAIKEEGGNAGEEEEKRLEIKTKPPKASDEPKEPVPDTPADAPMEVAPLEDPDFSAEAPEIGGATTLSMWMTPLSFIARSMTHSWRALTMVVRILTLMTTNMLHLWVSFKPLGLNLWRRTDLVRK